jgi:hypothetical protein
LDEVEKIGESSYSYQSPSLPEGPSKDEEELLEA